MVKFIIGQSATGKSVYLNEQVLQKIDDYDVNTNLTNADSLCCRDYDDDRVEHLQDVLDLCDIYLSESRIKVINSEVDVSVAFEEIITIICKKGDYLYLDEPEYCLSDWEVTRLLNLIIRVADSFEEVIIVTQHELLLGVLDREVYTMEYKDNRYVPKLFEGNVYEIID